MEKEEEKSVGEVSGEGAGEPGFDGIYDNSSEKAKQPTNTSLLSSARKLFTIPTISVEESLSEPETSNLIEELSSVQVNENEEEGVEENRDEVNMVRKETEKNVKSQDDEVRGSLSCSLESIPSLDGESESVSLGIKDDDVDGGGISDAASLTSSGSYCSGIQQQQRRRIIFEQKAKSLGQVHLPSSVKRKAKNNRFTRSAKSESGRYDEIQAEDLEKRLKALAAAFSARTVRTKAKIQQPPTPSSGESDSEESKPGEATLLDRLRQLASPDPSDFGDPTRRKSVISLKVKGTFLENLEYFWTFLSCNYILDPQSTYYVCWLVLVALFFVYNACVIPLRVVFPYQTERNVVAWFIFDSIADLFYLVDILLFKPHVKFIQNGFWVKEPKETVKTYLGSLQFKIDLIALCPADIFAHVFYKNLPILRITRFFKVDTFWELFKQLDSLLAHPHRARIFHTCLYMLYMIHMVACMYYALSTWEGIGTTTWTFDGIGNAYIRCFYFATKTATSIGKNVKPENELEYIFMTFAWLSGVFIFAILIGQIRDIIATATKSQTEYRILTSATISYLHRLGVPDRLQDRVKVWLSYTWEQQKTLDETRILNLLPKSMKAEIALNIHVETLGKVTLFQSCETAFLRDLVVKLRSVIILPGDFVCRKGEIGREMFIVKSGKIQVIGGSSGTQVLATLGEGSVFGEIALLGIGGMNKRTADVRAAGFVNLFVLIKSDLNDVIRDYPEAQEIMQKKAKKLMRENIKKARASSNPMTAAAAGGASDDSLSLAEESGGIIIKNKEESPQLIFAMMKLFPPTTKIGRYLRKGSKVNSVSELYSSCEDDEGDDDDDPNDRKSKLDDVYTSLTSYPPSPFMPISPGHISQQLDISVMTGDSLDKALSPLISRQNSWELPVSLSDHEVECLGSGNTSINQYDDDISIISERCQSPIPPFAKQNQNIIASFPLIQNESCEMRMKVEQIALESVDGIEVDADGGNSGSHFNFSSKVNRDEIPIELRPPLYIIQTKNGANEERRSSSGRSSRAKVLRRIVLESEQDSSFEDEENVRRYYEDDGISKRENDGGGGESVDDDVKATTSSSSASKRTAMIATQFISKMRGWPLKRQEKVDVVDVIPGKTRTYSSSKTSANSPFPLAKSLEVEVETTSYSLDMDSD